MRRLAVVLASLIIGLSACGSEESSNLPPRQEGGLEDILLEPLELKKSKRDRPKDREVLGATQDLQEETFKLEVPKSWVSLPVPSGEAQGVVLAYGEEGTGESLNIIQTPLLEDSSPEAVRRDLEAGGASEVKYIPQMPLDGTDTLTVTAEFTRGTRTLYTCQILASYEDSSYVLTFTGLDRDSTIETARKTAATFSWK